MQRGSLAMVSRKDGPSVWQFRWSEKDLHGIRVQGKRVIGTVERYRDEDAARSAVTVLLQEINSHKLRMGPCSITIAQLCDHFEQSGTVQNAGICPQAVRRGTACGQVFQVSQA